MKLYYQHWIKKKKTVRKRRKKTKKIQLAMKDPMNIEVQNVKVKEQLGKITKISKVLIMNFG